MSIDNIADISPRIQYVATAAQTDFDYPFPIFEDTDLVIDKDGVTQTLTTHYTVTGEGEDTGGTVTFVTPMTGGEVVTIYRDMAIERLTDFQQNGPYSSASLNDDLDRITLVLQDLKSGQERSLRFSPTSEATAAQTQFSPIANWLDKFVYINASGVPEPATAVAVSALTQATIGSTLYPQTAAELAAGVTPTNYYYEPGNVLRYGTNAVPGTTSMTVAFQNAVLANDYVWVPDGDYLISDNIDLRAGVHFDMAGGATLKASVRDWGATGVLVATNISNVVVTGGNIDGQKASNSTGECFGIDLRGASSVRIAGVRIVNMPGSEVAGTSGGDGIYVGYNSTEASPSQNVVVTGCILDANCRQGMSIVGGVGITVTGNQFINTSGTNPGAGIDIEANGSTNNLRDIQIVGNRFSGNYYGVVVTNYARNVSVTGNTFYDNGFIDIYVADCSHAVVSGNTIESVAKDATTVALIEVNSAQYASVIGNIIKGAQSDSNERAGIRVLQGDYITIAHNKISNMRTQAIAVGNSAQTANFTDVDVLGNMCIDNVVAAGTEAVIAVSGNSGSGFYPSRVMLRDNHVFDSRSAGNEADKGFDISTSIPAATRASYRMSGNTVSGPAAFMTGGTSPPLTAIFTWDPGSLADGAGETSASITVTGAALGDHVEVFPPYDLQDITCTGYVQAANTVEVRLQNESGGVIDLGNSASWKVRIRKFEE